jgi:hypothetical protein
MLSGWANEVKFWPSPENFLFPNIFTITNGTVQDTYYQLDVDKAVLLECGIANFVIDWGQKICTYDYDSGTTYPWKEDATQTETNGSIILVREIEYQSSITINKPNNAQFYSYINDVEIQNLDSENNGFAGKSQITTKLASLGWRVSFTDGSTNNMYTKVEFTKIWSDAQPIFITCAVPTDSDITYSDSFVCVLI